MRIGILGGTFDPPHLGHLVLASEACHQLALERLLFVLTPNPPHKDDQAVTLTAQRLDLLQAAIADNPQFELSEIDLERPAPHYAVDTVMLLRQRDRSGTLIYLMGSDSLMDLPNWHQPQEFVAACDQLGVMRRPGDQLYFLGLEKALPGVTKKVAIIKAPLLDISSSDIRLRIAQGQPYRYLLPEPVYRLIQERGLYKV